MTTVWLLLCLLPENNWTLHLLCMSQSSVRPDDNPTPLKSRSPNSKVWPANTYANKQAGAHAITHAGTQATHTQKISASHITQTDNRGWEPTTTKPFQTLFLLLYPRFKHQKGCIGVLTHCQSCISRSSEPKAEKRFCLTAFSFRGCASHLCGLVLLWSASLLCLSFRLDFKTPLQSHNNTPAIPHHCLMSNSIISLGNLTIRKDKLVTIRR